jgi:hypothetical protein
VLIAPQMAIVLVFFFWPAAQALRQSLLQQDAFGTSVEFVGLENFQRLFTEASYLASFKITAFFSIVVAVFGIGLSLLLAVFADRVVRGACSTGRCSSGPTRWRRQWPGCCGSSCSRRRWAWWRTRCSRSATTGTTCSMPTMR